MSAAAGTDWLIRLAGLAVFAILPMHGQLMDVRVTGLVATLSDETVSSGERIDWSTTWKLCWDRVPSATAYEVRAMTAEGPGRAVLTQTSNCHSVVVATGRNQRAQGLLNRDLLLALQAGQIAYSVRAHVDQSRSEWSPAMPAGRAGRLEVVSSGRKPE